MSICNRDSALLLSRPDVGSWEGGGMGRKAVIVGSASLQVCVVLCRQDALMGVKG